jgi:hypothetical protein
MKMNNQQWINSKRFIATLKLSPSSPHQSTKKSSTELMAWMWSKMCVTLRMAHEGSRLVRKAKVEMFEGQLNRFIMYDDEMPHEMLNRLKKLVNKARALGSKSGSIIC